MSRLRPSSAAETILRASTALLRAIIDTSPHVIFAKDLDGRTFANPAPLRLVGEPSRRFSDRPTGRCAGKVVARQVMETDERSMRSGEPAELEE